MSDNQLARKWFVRVLSASLALAFASLAPATDEGMAAADEVDQAIYYDLMDNWLYTHAGDDRGSGPEHDLARDNIAFLMESYGLTVTLEPFTYSGSTYHNVVGEKLGTVYPDQIYIIGAHFDSVNNPGADDNASGTATVLECARIISQYDCEYTVRFIAFDREEQGLVGSYAYVSAHSGDDILGMISADMVAYDTGTDHVSIYGRSASNPIKLLLGAAIEEYGGMTWTDYGQLDASDHAPFEGAGYQACLLIEGEVWSNPFYHTQQDNMDNPDNINWDYAYKMTRTAVGWMVDQAHVEVNFDGLMFTYPDGLPEFVAPSGGTKLRVEVTGMGAEVPEPGTGMLHYDIGSGWQSSTMEIVSDNVYDAVFPSATCGDEVLFYVSAEAVGGVVYTHPKNAPASHLTTLAAYGYAVAQEFTFDANPGWTMQGEWGFGQPTGQGGAYGNPDPSSGFTGVNVFGINLNGDYSTDIGGPYYVTTNAIDCSEFSGISLHFQRWLNSDYQPYVSQTIEVSSNGANWTLLWENGGGEIADNAWSEQAYDISAVADGGPAVYLRWGHEVGQSGAWAYSGWNIDDVQIVALDCNSPCPADVDGSGTVDIDDLFQVLSAWGTCDDCP